MKKLLIAALIVAASCALLAACSYRSTSNVDKTLLIPKKVKQSAAMPELFTGNILTKQLLLKATKISDGYLLGDNAIEKYDLSGKLVWRKTYPFFSKQSPSVDVCISPLPDGSFVFSCCAEPEHSTVLAQCDRNGELLWEHVMGEFSGDIVKYIFQTGSGDILTIGSAGELPGGPDHLRLFLFSQNGELIKTAQYGGSDFDQLWGADYLKGVGVVANVLTQSKDGTFSASTDGYGVNVLTLINDDLSITWKKTLSAFITSAPLLTTHNAIYLLDSENKLYKYDYSGTAISEERLAAKTVSVHFVDCSSKRLVVGIGNNIMFYNNDLEVEQKIAFNGGDASRILQLDDGFVIASTRITGELPTPPQVSAIWYSSEVVYSGYSQDGVQLWRKSYDSTPQAYYDYDPDDPKWK